MAGSRREFAYPFPICCQQAPALKVIGIGDKILDAIYEPIKEHATDVED